MAKCGATVTRRSMDNRVKRFHERDAALAREATIAAHSTNAKAVADQSFCSPASLLTPTHDTRAVAAMPGTGSEMHGGMTGMGSFN